MNDFDDKVILSPCWPVMWKGGNEKETSIEPFHFSFIIL